MSNEDNRIQRVEEKVDVLSEDLRKHVIDETGTFKEMHIAIERLATTSEHQSKVMDRMADVLAGDAQRDIKLSVMEVKVDRYGTLLDGLVSKTEDTKDEVEILKTEKKTIIWIGGILASLLGAAWAVVTFIVGK